MPNLDKQDAAQITTTPLPASQKVYVHSHAHADIMVGMRAITLSDAPHGHTANGNAKPPFMVYDTSGPYTDPTTSTDIRRGLKPLRLGWIRARGDVEEI